MSDRLASVEGSRLSRFSWKIAIPFCALLLAGCGSEGSGTDTQIRSEPDEGHSQGPVERRVRNPYPDASELRLYVETSYDSDSGEALLLREKGVRLSAAQRKKFEDALSIGPAPEEMAACFIPHHFFRYFDDTGKQVGEVAVCFCCQGVSASGSKTLQTAQGEALAGDYPAIQSVVAEVGEPTDVLCD